MDDPPDIEGLECKTKRCYGKSITADYRHSFGNPRMVKSGYRADILLQAIVANGIDGAMHAYGVEKSELQTVIDYAMKLIYLDGCKSECGAFWDGWLSQKATQEHTP